MTTITENDLKRLEDLINTRFNQLQEEIKDLKKSNQNIELGQAKIEGQLKGWEPSVNKISDLAEKTGELKGWKQTALIIISVFGGSIFGWFLRREFLYSWRVGIFRQ